CASRQSCVQSYAAAASNNAIAFPPGDRPWPSREFVSSYRQRVPLHWVYANSRSSLPCFSQGSVLLCLTKQDNVKVRASSITCGNEIERVVHGAQAKGLMQILSVRLH